MRMRWLFAFPSDKTEARSGMAPGLAFGRRFPDITRKQPVLSETGRGLLYRPGLRS